jgi:NADPH-dependent 2,4-dienoyl-CoA reductase/sulfur reductase-like enzyme
MNNNPENCDVAIVGGGTAGLALATELKRLGVKSVVILERDTEAGGVPRHCGHYPFGLHEFKRLMKGPEYARALVKKAMASGVDIRTSTTVTALHPNARLSLSTPERQTVMQAKRVVLCTGVRESSRAQRFLGGQRPQGIITTGALQSMIYLNQMRPFNRPVILGTELVSFSAIMTCRHMGMRPIAMIEENPRVSVRQYMRPYPMMKGVPIKFNASDIRIVGDRTVEAIEYLDKTGVRQRIETDGVIISGKFRPESALLRATHLDIDPGTGGPAIDQYGRASDISYFCAGNLMRPAETSSWCWHEAVETAGRVVRDMEAPIGNVQGIELRPYHPSIRFVVPQRLVSSDTAGAMEFMQIGLSKPARGYLTASCGGETISRHYINSRPVRRILTPLKPLISAKVSAPISLRVLKS